MSLREPRAGDINRYGNPVRVNQDGDVIIDERKMTYMMAALSGILPPFIEEMDPRDWNSCAYRLRAFFSCPIRRPGRRRGRDHPRLLPARPLVSRQSRTCSCRCRWTTCLLHLHRTAQMDTRQSPSDDDSDAD